MTSSSNATNPLRVSTLRGVKIYNCTAGKTLPQWMEEAVRKQRSLRYDQEFRRRIELIQDFGFPTASQKVKVSRDGQYIAASGVYKPQIRVFDVQQLSMKFERHVDAEIVQMQMLSDDYSKMVLLRADRTIEVHAKFGMYHATRVPKFGRDIAYHYPSCDLYIAGSSPDVWRLNLDQGRYMASVHTNLPGINVIGVNPVHQLMAFCGENGVVEFWDPRDHQRAAELSVSEVVAQHINDRSLSALIQGSEITAQRFDVDGLGMALGTSSGHVLLFDIRSSRPLLTKDHRYGLPIRSIKYHHSSGNIVSADSKSIRLWNKKTGVAYTSVEPMADIAHIALCGDSGMILAAGEHPRIQIYYIPQLGPAPRWASYLDTLTEELEESGETTLYDDYKFVTRADLQDWGVDHLIGSNLLRAYMHGFFMDIRLYNRVKSVAQPDAYDKYIKRQIDAKIKERREAHLALQKTLPEINRQYAKVLLQKPALQRQIQESTSGAHPSQPAVDIVRNPLLDERFKDMFQSEDFEIDPASADFVRLHPSSMKHSRSAEEEAPSTSSQHVDDGEHSSSDEEYATRTSLGVDRDRFRLVGSDRGSGRYNDDVEDDDDEHNDEYGDDYGDDFVNREEEEIDDLFGVARYHDESADSKTKRVTHQKSQNSKKRKQAKRGRSMYALMQGRLEHVMQDQAESERQKRRRAKSTSLQDRLRQRHKESHDSGPRQRTAAKNSRST